LQNIAKNIVACRGETAKSLNLVLLEESKSPEFLRKKSRILQSKFPSKSPGFGRPNYSEQHIFVQIFIMVCKSLDLL
jgi:hypothetical protein